MVRLAKLPSAPVAAHTHTLDHGSDLTGLTDDDHTQYLKEEASGGLASEVPDHTHASGAEAGTVSHAVLTGVTANQHHNQAHAIDGADHTGTLDHGALGDLTSDDHTQYLKEEASGGLASEVPDHTHASGAEAGTVSHAVLTGVTADQHHAQLHSSAHAENAADELLVELLGTAETDTNLRLAPDGTGGVEFAAGGSGGGHAFQDEGTAVAVQAAANFIGIYNSVQNDAAASASDIRSGYAEIDAIVDSAQWEALVTDTADSVTATSIDVTGAGWVASEWVGCRVLIYNAGGTTLRGVRVITSNDTDTINWSGAVAGIVAGDSFIIQPSPPVYRRLAEAIAGGHLSIRYRAASGELAGLSIDTGSAVNHIIGDDNADATISVNVTCTKTGVVFDTLNFSGVVTLSGTSCTAVGCRVTGTGSQIIVSSGSRIVNCAAIAAGSGANSPFVIDGQGSVTACVATLLTCQSMITATANAAGYSIIGNSNSPSGETGYIIDIVSTARGICTANVITTPTTGSGGIRCNNLGNIAGNFIDLATATQDAINIATRNIVSGNLIRLGSLSGTNTLNGVHMTGDGNVMSSNLLIVSTALGGTCTVNLAALDSGADLNTVSLNTALIVVGTTGTFNLISAAGTPDYVAFGNTGISSSPTTAPTPWRQTNLMGARTLLLYNTEMPESRVWVYDRVEDFDDNALPLEWVQFGTGGTGAYGAGVGGQATLATGAVINQDVGINLQAATVAGSGERPGVEAWFDLNSVANVRFRIGLGDLAGWVTNMARPTDGLFLELDTAVSANFFLIMKVGATVQSVDLGTATTGIHRFSAFVQRGNHLAAWFDGSRVGTNSATGIWPAANLVAPGAFIRALAAANKEADIDMIRWLCERS